MDTKKQAGKKVKKKCCRKYEKKGKYCSKCPLGGGEKCGLKLAKKGGACKKKKKKA